MSLADDIHSELCDHGVLSEGMAWALHDRLVSVEARLAAVIALCDSDMYCDSGSMFCHDIRAAATGATE